MPKRAATTTIRIAKRARMVFAVPGQVRWRTSQRQPSTPLSYVRWEGPGTSLTPTTDQILINNPGGTNATVIAYTMYSQVYGVPHDVRCYTEQGEEVSAYTFIPTPAQPFIHFSTPKGSQIQKIQINATGITITNTVHRVKLYYSP